MLMLPTHFSFKQRLHHRSALMLLLHGLGCADEQNLCCAEAVPKRILDLMNVEGLTRENVASHLQVACRPNCISLRSTSAVTALREVTALHGSRSHAIYPLK